MKPICYGTIQLTIISDLTVYIYLVFPARGAFRSEPVASWLPAVGEDEVTLVTVSLSRPVLEDGDVWKTVVTRHLAVKGTTLHVTVQYSSHRHHHHHHMEKDMNEIGYMNSNNIPWNTLGILAMLTQVLIRFLSKVFSVNLFTVQLAKEFVLHPRWKTVSLHYLYCTIFCSRYLQLNVKKLLGTGRS